MSESELLESTTLETQSLGEKETHRQPKLTLHNSYRQKSIRYLDNLKTQRLNQSSCSSQQKEESIHGSPLLKASSDAKYVLGEQETKEQTPQDVNVEQQHEKVKQFNGNGKYDKLEVNVIEELQNSHRSSKRSSILKPKTSQRQSRVPTPRGNIEIKILETDLLQQELERFNQQDDRNIDFQSKQTQNLEQSIIGQKEEDEMDERELYLIKQQLSQCQVNFKKVLDSTDNISDVTQGNPNEMSPVEIQIEQRKAVQFIGNEEKISIDLTQVNFEKERRRKRLQSDTSRKSNWSQRSLSEKAQTLSLPVIGSMIISALGFGITKLILNGKKQIVGVVPGIALGAVQLYNTIREEQMIDSDSDCDE
ncbi:hypothetical protein pb186bvf_012722 [Paramecium bursaria]